MNIRNAQTSDLEQITEIYNYYIINTAFTFDLNTYRASQREEWLSQYSPKGPYQILVAEIDGNVIGYCSSNQFQKKPAYNTSVATSIYLSQNTFSQGIGTRLYSCLFDSIKDQGLHRAFAGVALPNEKSINFHKKFQFRSIGKYGEAGYKFGKFWDVEWLQKDL